MWTDLTDFLSNGIPSKVEATLIAVSTVLFGWLSLILGGIDLPVKWLFTFVVIDFVMGVVADFKAEKWCSKGCGKEIFRKISIFFFVALSHGIDIVCGTDFMRNGAIAAYALVEVGSIITQVDALGYGHLIPTFIRQGIKAIETKQEKKWKGVKKNDQKNRD